MFKEGKNGQTHFCSECERLSRENIKKDKVIEKMASFIHNNTRTDEGCESVCSLIMRKKSCNWGEAHDCEKCYIEYFTNKAEESEDKL